MPAYGLVLGETLSVLLRKFIVTLWGLGSLHLVHYMWLGNDYALELWDREVPSVAECILRATKSLNHTRIKDS